MNPDMSWSVRRAFREALLLVLLALPLAAGVNAIRPNGLPLLENFAEREAAAARARFKTLSPLQAAELLKQGQAVFVDARQPDAFAMAHVPKAVNLTPAQAAAGEGRDLPRDKTIVIYCDGMACGASHAVAEELLRHGLDVAVLDNGIEGWIMTRGPLERAE